MEKEADQEQEIDVKTVNINSVKLNTNHSTIIVNLRTSSNKVITIVPNKVDMGSDGNIMPLYMYKKLFPGATTEHWQQQEIQTSS